MAATKKARFLRSGGVGVYADAKFEMNPGDLNAFVASTLLQKPLTTHGMPNNVQWLGLDEKALKSYLFGSYDSPAANGGVVQNILIDTTNATSYTVYISYQAG